MATSYTQLSDNDLQNLQAGDQVYFGDKMNWQSPTVQKLLNQGAIKLNSNGNSFVNGMVTKPYLAPTTTATPSGTPLNTGNSSIYGGLLGNATFDYNNPTTGYETAIDTTKQQLLDAQDQSLLDQQITAAQNDEGAKWDSIAGRAADTGGRNMGTLNRILGQAGGFTTTAGGQALVAQQTTLDNQLNDIRQQEMAAKASLAVALKTNNQSLISSLAKNLSDYQTQAEKIKTDRAKNLLDLLDKTRQEKQDALTQQDKLDTLTWDMNKFGITQNAASQKDLNDFVEKGNNYVSTPAERDKLKALGYTITVRDGKTYAKAPEHSTAYKEWEDYKNTGGKLSFNDYQTMDANRKAVRQSTTYNINSPAAQSDIEGIGADISAIKGPDGKLDTAKYAQIRDNVAKTTPKLLDWFDKTYDPKIVLNPKDPTAAQYFQSGNQLVQPTDAEKLTAQKSQGYTKEQATQEGWPKYIIDQVYGTVTEDKPWWKFGM